MKRTLVLLSLLLVATAASAKPSKRPQEIRLVGTCEITETPFLDFAIVLVYRKGFQNPARLLVWNTILPRFAVCGTGRVAIVTGYVPDVAVPAFDRIPYTPLIATGARALSRAR